MDISWDIDREQDWQARIAEQPYPALRQDWSFGAVMQGLGASVGRAIVYEGGKVVAVAQVLQRRGVRLIGQGPVWLVPLEPAQKRRIICRLARHTGVSIVTPQDNVSGIGIIPLITPRSFAIWNINMPPDALRQSLQGKWRNRLVRAEEAVKPMHLPRARLQELITHEAAQRSKRGYKNLPGAVVLDWPGGTLAIGWYSGGALQAGMVFLIHGRHASYFLGWANQTARESFAHGPMLWQAALSLRGRGVEAIDLGVVNSGSGASLARFKLGTGAGVVTAGATSLVLPIG